MPNILLSYGVIFIIQIENGVSPWQAIFPPCFYIVSWTLADPWCREAVDSWGGSIGARALASSGVLLTFISMALGAFILHPMLFAVWFGILGGLGTSLVLTQVHFVVHDTFDTSLNQIQTVCQYAQAIGLCTIPHIIFLLFHYFGSQMGMMMTSCLVLQILPAMLFLKTKTLSSERFGKNYTVFKDDVSVTSDSNSMQLLEMSSKYWKGNSYDNLSKNDEELEGYYKDENLFNVEKIKAFVGVDILPQILEESESMPGSSRSSYNYNFTSVNCVDEESSGINESDNRKSEKDTVNGDCEWNTVEDQTNPKRHFKKQVNPSLEWIGSENILTPKCFPGNMCKTYKCYRVKKKVRNAWDCFEDTFIAPLFCAVKTAQFYPALLFKVMFLCVPFCASPLVTLMGKFSILEAPVYKLVVLVPIQGVSWLCLLILTPWFAGVSKTKYKYFAASGCLVCSIGLLVIMESSRFAYIVLGSAIVGLGYGTQAVTSEGTLRETIGARKWSKLRGTLETLSAFIILFIALLMGYLLRKTNGIKECAGFIIGLLGISGLLLNFIPLTALIVKKQITQQNLWPLMT